MNIVAILYNKIFYRPYIKKNLKKCGRNFKLGYSSELINPSFFRIGNDFFSGPRGYFVTNRNNPVRIGNAVMFGPDCKIIGGNHDTNFTDNHMYFNKNIDHMKEEIIINDGAWIGSNSIILSGAVVEEGAVIGAMSLVNNYIPPYTIAVGIPSKKIRPRFKNEKELKVILSSVKSKFSFEEVNKIYKKYDISYNE